MENGSTLRKISAYFILTVLGLAFFLPFAIMALGSLQKMELALLSPTFWFPRDFTWVNYDYIFASKRFFRWILNSLIITLIPVFSTMFFCSILGYVFSKKVFPFRETIFWSLMAVVMIPSQLLIIPKFLMFVRFGWINEYYSLIVPELWNIMGVFLVRQFMMTIPKDLEEAANMDGANDVTIFFRIMLPLAKPAVATIGTFAFISNWNDLFNPLIFMNSQSMYPVTVGLASLLNSEGNFGVEMAGAVLSFIPTFLIFLFFQRYFTDGITMTGIK